MATIQFQLRYRNRNPVANAELVLSCKTENRETWKSETLACDGAGGVSLGLPDKLLSQFDWSTVKSKVTLADQRLAVIATKGPIQVSRGRLAFDITVSRRDVVTDDNDSADIPSGPGRPSPDDEAKSITLFFSLSHRNGRPAAGVRFVLTYDLPVGGAWESKPMTSSPEGRLSIALPSEVRKSIDWGRVGYQLSRRGKTLQVVDRSAVDRVEGGFAVALTLGRMGDDIHLPQPKDGRWYVRGRVHTASGKAVAAKVSAAAIRLSGANVIGRAKVDEAGRYEIAYVWDAQCAPDLQVSAKAGNKLIAQSPIRFAVSKSVRIDLITGNETYAGPTEFQRVEARVLRCNDDFNIETIGRKEFEYLLGKTRLPQDTLTSYLVARRLASLCDVPTAVFYGLFRARLPTSLQGLILQDANVLEEALVSSIKRNVIDRDYADHIDRLGRALRQLAVEGSLNNNQQLEHAGVGDLLSAVKVPKNVHEPLVNLYFDHEGDDASFWKALRKNKQLGKHAGKVKLSLQAGALASYHLPTMTRLTAQLGTGADIKDLAVWQESDWQDFRKSLDSVPDGIAGTTKAARARNYVDGMRRTVRRAFAREHTTANVLRSETFENPALRSFLKANPEFDYGTSSVPAVLDKADVSGEQRAEFEKSLKGMQRLYRVAPAEQKFEVVESLYAGGLTSARDIARLGSAQFIDRYAQPIGGTEVAEAVFNNAVKLTAVSTNMLAAYSEAYSASDVFAIGGGVIVSHGDAGGDLAIPSYADLFGFQSFCECEHCSSVYSPAAYFVDLLEYLRKSLVTSTIGGAYVKVFRDGQWVNKTGLDVLFARRADLGDIRLDCKNTNTVLPYIDLVNEVFERAVIGETDSRLYQTIWTEAELKANPEHILPAAYDLLAETKFPLALPFRLWNVEAEHYLAHMGVPRWELMRTVLDVPDSTNANFELIFQAHLGLTAMDVGILTGAPEFSGSLASVGEMWGYVDTGWRAELARVPEFLLRSNLSFDELRELMEVEYISAAGQVGVDFSDAESACDIEGAVIRYLVDGVFENKLLSKVTVDKIQRFLRLRLKTGWSIWELGRVLSALQVKRIGAQTITQVSVLKRVTDTLALDLVEVASWWWNLDTALKGTDPEYRSFYESLFLNPAVLNPPDAAFLLDPTHPGQLAVESAGGASISEHLSSIASALQITESEAALIAGALVGADGQVDDSLTLANLSQLYRIASLCRAKDIEVKDYLLIERMVGVDPWNANRPQALLKFLSDIQTVKDSAFSFSELGYLLLHDEENVASEQMPATTIADVLTDIQTAVRGVWSQYEITSARLVEQLTNRLAAFFDQSESNLIVELVGQQEARSADDIFYLEEALGFLDPVAANRAIDQRQAPDVRYERLLVLLNSYGREIGSVAVVSHIISETFSLELSAAELILTEVVTRGTGTGEYVIGSLLDRLFIDSGKEKLAAEIDAEYLQEAFDIIESMSSLPEADIEDFIVQHFDFLDTDDAKAQLVCSDALEDAVERYQYVTSPLDAAEYEFTEVVFGEQFSSIRRIQKTALIVDKFGLTHTELPILNDAAVRLDLLPLADFPFEELTENISGFNAWQELNRALTLREVFADSDTNLFAQLERAAQPHLIDTTSANSEVDALIADGQWSETDRPLLVWLDDFASAAGWNFSELQFTAGAVMLGLSLSDLLDISNLIYIRDVNVLAGRLGTTVSQIEAWAALDVTQTDAANAKQAARARYELDQWYEVASTLRDALREKQRDALTAYMLHDGGFANTVQLYNHCLIDSEMSACMMTSRLKLALSSTQLFLQRCLLNLEEEFVEVCQPDEWDWRKNYRVWEANRKVFLYPENWIEPELRISRSEIFDAAQSILLQNEVTREVAEQSILHYLEELDEVSNVEVVGSYHEQGPVEDGLPKTDRLHVVGHTRGVPHKYFYRVRDGKNWAPWKEIDADIDAEQVLPVVVDRRLYLLWPMFFEKQITGTDYFDEAEAQAQIDSYLERTAYDDYLNYLLHFDYGVISSHASLYLDGYASVQEWADALGATLEDTIEFMVDDLDADSWETYSSTLREEATERLSGAVNYYEIRLAVSEYRNAKWSAAQSSEQFVESDKHRSAVALLDSSLPPATPTDFHFYTEQQANVVTIECVQTLRYTDGNSYHFNEGRFEYDILSKQILAFESQDDIGWLDLLLALFGIIGNRSITSPTGTTVAGNAFLEGVEPKLEIPRIEAGASTTFVALLEQTPDTFRVPLQHQYEQFSADDAFFYADGKRSYMVSAVAGSGLITDYELGDLGNLDGYVKSLTPGFGVYEGLAGLSESLASVGNVGPVAAEVGRTSRARAKMPSFGASPAEGLPSSIALEAQIDVLQTTSVTQYYSLGQDNYQFESFYHPYVGDLIKKVNGVSIAAALSLELQSTSEDYFAATYMPTDRVKTVYPNRSFAFTDINAYGFYNWEFFFHLPLLIATRLSKNQQFEEAQKWFHVVFDPTSRSEGDGAQRFWQFRPFADLYTAQSGHPSDSIYDMLHALAADPNEADAETLALKEQTEEQIAVWLANPFDPHAIAALRPVAYMKATVMKYLGNLIDWGDYLYEQFTIESINEATQYYLLAYQILGERPVALPELNVVARSYNELGELDAFSNAVAELENVINLPTTSGATSTTIPPLYFCIPNNPNLLQYWDTVEDRLFKIRHCMTIEGVVRQLPLFEPPIDPGLLVLARASGVDIGAALASLATPAPHYRFVYLLQKAVEYCGVVEGLGSQLLAALEKQDAEGLSLLRAEHEESLLKASTEIRNLQVDEARENLTAFERSKALVEERIAYYAKLEKRSEKEKGAGNKLSDGEKKRAKSATMEKTASEMNMIPNKGVSVGWNFGASPSTSLSLSSGYGGSNIGASFGAKASKYRSESGALSFEANKLTIDAQHDRRWNEWKLQERLARKELKQVEKQIVAAAVRLALAEKERDNHSIQLEQAREVRDYMIKKFTNAELYGWMASQMSSIYFRSYQSAYELAKRSEKAYLRESGEYEASYIAYGYWDGLKKGLMSGDRLHHDLQRMEAEYLNNNSREFELSKHVSLVQLDPSALIALRETGECFTNLPEILFDFDYPGHYFRRVKSVSLSIPAITGPYTSMSCTLTLQSDRVRTVARTDDGEQDDGNFKVNLGSVESIATSSAQFDSGMFQMDFKDERYLPFEGSGVIGEWKLKLNNPKLAQFDYGTISDVIMHMSYTARDGGDVFRGTIESRLLLAVSDYFGTGQALQNLISIKHTMSDEWARLANTDGEESYRLSVNLGLDNFPYYLRARGIKITNLKLALNGEVDVSGWEKVALPGTADNEGNQPYAGRSQVPNATVR